MEVKVKDRLAGACTAICHDAVVVQTLLLGHFLTDEQQISHQLDVVLVHRSNIDDFISKNHTPRFKILDFGLKYQQK